MRVGVNPGLVPEPRPLHRSRVLHPGPDGGAGLARLAPDQIAIGDRGNLEVDVDPVEQRAGDPRAVALDGQRAAVTGMRWIARVATGTSPRCLFAMST